MGGLSVNCQDRCGASAGAVSRSPIMGYEQKIQNRQVRIRLICERADIRLNDLRVIGSRIDRRIT